MVAYDGLYNSLYDSLVFLKNTSSQEAEKLKKKFQKLFKEEDLDIVNYNLKITNYLGITLRRWFIPPYRKFNKETNYIHVNQSLKKFHDQLEKYSQFCHHWKIFYKSRPFTIKNNWKKTGYKTKLTAYNNQKKTKKKKT